MEQNQMLDFVKALAHADRLRIIGVLTKSPASARQVASALGMEFKDAVNHLSYLQYVGAVRIQISGALKQDDVYELDSENVGETALKHFSGDKENYIPSPALDEKSRKVLATCLNADGSIAQIPNHKSGKLQIVLDYILQAFTPGVIYTEKEVNTIIRRFHIDTAGLRRDMIDLGMLQRKSDGSAYWRPE